MGTWVKETDRAIYLMEGGNYIASVTKYPSQSNAKERVCNGTTLKSWFARSDHPGNMTVAVGTGSPEPSPIGRPPEGITGLEFNGQLQIIRDTFLKLSPKMASELNAQEKIRVKAGTVLQIRLYRDVGQDHGLIELVDPQVGNGLTTTWYVYALHARLGTNAVLTVTADTFFKQEPKSASQLPDSAKVFVARGSQFRLDAFMPAAADHTQVELADLGLGPNNRLVWYVYNPHCSAAAGGGGGGGTPIGMQVRAVRDTFFTLSPQPAAQLPAGQKVQVPRGTVLDIQYYVDLNQTYWLLELGQPLGSGGKAWYINTQDVKLVSAVTLTVLSDTIFKLEPQQSSALPDFSKVPVARGTQFQLIYHLPAAGSHTRIELANTTLGVNQETSWYVYSPHIRIVGQRQFLWITSGTVLKTSTADANTLPADQKISVAQNTIFELSAYGQPANNHVKVTLKGAKLGSQQRNTWYCYVHHIYIIGTEIGNDPDDNGGSSGNSGGRGIPLQFPGFTGTYYSNDPIFWQTQYNERGHFTWGEALHVNAATGQYRRPTSSDVIYGIQRIARAMEDIRRRYGNVPIQINSWYRDPATNAAVGGASQSRHLVGDALDFVVSGVHPYDVYADLDAWWGSQGGLASSQVFTHIDARGYKARWEYGKGYDQRGQQASIEQLRRSAGTWIKETDRAMYLMKGNTWISRITKTLSSSNPQEKVLNITGMEAWFTRPDAPTAMTIAIGSGAPEPDPWVPPPPASGEINAAGLAIVKHFEGLRTTAYLDAVGIWTIGYGHTSMAGPPPVYPGMTITVSEAEAILKRDLDLFEQGVSNALTIETNSDQYSAMVSFAFNVGLGAYRDSTLLRKHNAGDFAGAANEFLRWVNAGGQVLPGLVRRREAERALYLSQDSSKWLRESAFTTIPASVAELPEEAKDPLLPASRPPRPSPTEMNPVAASSSYVGRWIAGFAILVGLCLGAYIFLFNAQTQDKVPGRIDQPVERLD